MRFGRGGIPSYLRAGEEKRRRKGLEAKEVGGDPLSRLECGERKGTITRLGGKKRCTYAAKRGKKKEKGGK